MNQCLQNDITINGAHMWNTLKPDIKNSSSLSKFKRMYLQDILALTISDIEHSNILTECNEQYNSLSSPLG